METADNLKQRAHRKRKLKHFDECDVFWYFDIKKNMDYGCSARFQIANRNKIQNENKTNENDSIRLPSIV